MFAFIKRFLDGLFGRKQIEPPPTPPQDPYAYRTAPRKRGPYERGGVVAVLEPEDDEQPALLSRQSTGIRSQKRGTLRVQELR